MTNWKSRIVGHAEVDPKTLNPNPLNFRDHPEYQRKVMRGILDELGWIQAVIVNKTTGNVLDGHLRIDEAIKSEETTVPVIYVELTEEEEKKALLSYDSTSSLAKAGRDNLEKLIKTVAMNSASAQDMVNNLARKHKIDINKFTDSGDEMNNVTIIPEIEPEQDDWIVEVGDLFEIHNPTLGITHRLICGDNMSDEVISRLLGGVKPTLMVTSPPYNQKIDGFKASGMQKENTAFVDRMASSYSDNMPEEKYQSAQIEFINKYGKLLSPNGSIFYNHKIRYRDKEIVSPMEWLTKIDYTIRQEIIWNRGGSVTLNARMFIPCDERIYWIRIGKNFIFNDETEIKTWSSVWKFAAKNDIKVSAAFPFELPYRCILACTAPKDAVLDPYSGSGTTIVAANRTNRIGYGIELSPDYVYKSLKRFEKEGLVVKKV